MKKALTLCLIAFAIAFTCATAAFAQCTDIQDGTIVAADGALVTTGYDTWGYNYQAHMFNGTYCDSYRNAAWCQPYADVELIMKWNDAWISNQDCDSDGKLDRHYGFASYKGSGAWLTNHQSGTVEVDGKMKKWTYFSKIVAVPIDAVLGPDNNWYTANGKLIGAEIWGEFAVIEEILNDPSVGAHGRLDLPKTNPGLGH